MASALWNLMSPGYERQWRDLSHSCSNDDLMTCPIPKASQYLAGSEGG